MRRVCAAPYEVARDANQMARIIINSVSNLYEYTRSDDVYDALKEPDDIPIKYDFEQLSLTSPLPGKGVENITTWDNRLRKYCKHKAVMKPFLQGALNMIIVKRDEAMGERGFLKRFIGGLLGEDGSQSACYIFYDLILHQVFYAGADSDPSVAQARLQKLHDNLRSALVDCHATPSKEAEVFSKNVNAILERLQLLGEKYAELALKLTLKDHLNEAQDNLRDIFVYSFSELKALLAGEHIGDLMQYTALSAAEETLSSDKIRSLSPSLRLLHLFYMSDPMSEIITGLGKSKATETTGSLVQLLDTTEFHRAMLDKRLACGNIDPGAARTLPELRSGDSLLSSSLQWGRGNDNIFHWMKGDGKNEDVAMQLAQNYLQSLASLSRLARLYRVMQGLGDAVGILGDTLIRYLPEGVSSLGLLRKLLEHEVSIYEDKMASVRRSHEWISAAMEKKNPTQYRCLLLNSDSAKHFATLNIGVTRRLFAAFSNIELRLQSLSRERVNGAIERIRFCARELVDIAKTTAFTDPSVAMLESFVGAQAGAGAGAGAGGWLLPEPIPQPILEQVELLEDTPEQESQPVPAAESNLNELAVFQAVKRARAAYNSSGSRYRLFGFACASSAAFETCVHWGDISSMSSLNFGAAIAALGATSSWTVRTIGPNSFRITVLSELADTVFGKGRHPYTRDFHWSADYKEMMAQLLWHYLCGQEFFEANVSNGSFTLPSSRHLHLAPLRSYLNRQLTEIIDLIINDAADTSSEARQRDLQEAVERVERLRFLRIDSSQIFVRDCGYMLVGDFITQLSQQEPLKQDARTYEAQNLVVLEERLGPTPMLLPQPALPAADPAAEVEAVVHEQEMAPVAAMAAH